MSLWFSVTCIIFVQFISKGFTTVLWIMVWLLLFKILMNCRIFRPIYIFYEEKPISSRLLITPVASIVYGIFNSTIEKLITFWIKYSVI